MSIIRIKHSNKFVTLSRDSLWDTKLSLKAVGLWARCMSRPDNWTFHVSELAKSGKEKECAIYAAINELIEAGYVLRFRHRAIRKVGKNGKEVNVLGSVEYVFFEKPLTDQDKAEYEQELKKCFLHRGFQDLGFLDQGNRDALINTNIQDTSPISSYMPDSPIEKDIKAKKERDSGAPPRTRTGESIEKKNKPANADSPPSSASLDAVEKLISSMRAIKFEFEPWNPETWGRPMQDLLTQYGVDRVLKVIAWYPKNPKNLIFIKNAFKFRDHFLDLEIEAECDSQMESKRLARSRIEANKAYAQLIKSKHNLKDITIHRDYAINNKTGKDAPFDLPEAAFDNAFKSLVGGSHAKSNQ